MASKYDRWHLCGPPCVYQPFSVAPPAPVVSDYAPAARGHKRPWVCLTDHHRANLPSSFSSSRGSCLNIGELISPGEHESLHRLALSHFPRAFASSLGVVHSPPCSVYSAIPVISPLLRRPASPLLAHSLDWGSAWPGLASSAMRVAAMDADLRIPDIPLAKEEDIDSNKNSQTDEMIHCEEEVRLSDELSGSLEDLVGNFEEKVVKCLKDPDVNTEDIAPVQVRTQDEIMSESQTWWTLTGNFGNIQPLDFHKSVIRQNMMPGLDLKERKNSDDGGVESCDEDELRAQLDMHQLVSQGSLGDSPPQTADQVIEEIDEMLQSCDFSMSMMTDRTMESVDSMYSSMRSPLPSGHSSDADTKLRQAQAIASSPENLQELSYSKLVSLNAEMEQLIQVYNESLVEELALRDELEYEKEMKNSFISLLLSIQNKRRQFANERKRKAVKVDPSQLPQFMTASIPYNDGQNIDNATLASLIKILKAINDDNSLVPTLLTDYILNVVCPKTAVC